MNKNTSKLSLRKSTLFSLLLMCSLFIPQNLFSLDKEKSVPDEPERTGLWNGHFVKADYNASENTITFSFIVFDYYFSVTTCNAYLRWCDFYYTTDGEGYYHLMRVETDDQALGQNWTWLKMRYKRPHAQLQFLGCFEPYAGSMWPEGGADETIKVNNQARGEIYEFFQVPGKRVKAGNPAAMFTVKWYLGNKYKGVQRIKIDGLWHFNGANPNTDIKDVYYDIPSASMLKSTELKAYTEPELKTPATTNSAVIVSTEGDAVVIKGAELGENIKIYTATGTEIKSIVTKNDVVKVKLPVKQVYVVNVGQARYKVAL